jgi:hypothetical protein
MNHTVEEHSSNVKLSLVLLVKEIMSQLDDVHAFRKAGHSGQVSMYLLKEMTSVLKDLDAQTQQLYLDILVSLSTAENITPRNATISESYATSSKPVKELFVAKMREQLLKTGT